MTRLRKMMLEELQRLDLSGLENSAWSIGVPAALRWRSDRWR